MTLIEVRNSEGVVGRCDAKCYDAHGPGCDCICHGANHGAGLTQAAANTRELGLAWLEEWAVEHGEDRTARELIAAGRAALGRGAAQLPLEGFRL